MSTDLRAPAPVEDTSGAWRTARSRVWSVISRLDPLAGPNGLDPYLRHLDRTWSGHDIRGRIVALGHPTTDSVRLTVRPSAGWTGFVAGQHVTVGVEIDGVRHQRCFSPATSTHRSDTFDLIVKVHPGSVVGRHLRSTARVGDVVGIDGPSGNFTLPEPAARPDRMLLVSGGSGCTPILSMIRTLADERHSGAVTWLHYDRSPKAVVHDADLDRLRALLPGLRTFTAFTRADGTGDLDGHLTEAHLDHVEPGWRGLPIWACGPAALLGDVRTCFDAAGVPDAVHAEAFTFDLAPAPASYDGGGTVSLRRSGRTIDDDGRPLLVQAEAAGLSPAHGCRMGICHTCTTPLVAGTVRDPTSAVLTTVAPGDPCGTGVRLCVSAPVGDVELDL